MRLPRRVPWASLAELDQVCSWIYTDENDSETKVLALQRMSAWRAITALPHALESTLSILTIIVQDTANEGPSSYLLVREAYAAALIRLVNGLVDPLQLGAYARSIASIATQLGLPAWLVELRHAATHEDLPSLEVLRQASRDAMVWLLNNYWIPTLNPSIPAETQKAPLRPLAPLLTQYKSLLKTTTRDASLRTQYKADTTKILRDIERWIAEAKVAADVSTSALDWDPHQDEEGTEDDSRERWALDRLSDGLLEKGGLVPLSKKKRGVNNSPFQPSAAVLAIWTPLLKHLHALHPSLPSVLVGNAIKILLSAQEELVSTVEADTISFADGAGGARDPSYDMCLASWAFWLATELEDGSGSSDNDSRVVEEAVVSLITRLGPMSRTSDTQAAHHLLTTFTTKYPKLQESTQLLLSTASTSGTSIWSQSDLGTMSERLSALMAARQDAAGSDDACSQAGVESREEDSVQLPAGWRKLSARDGWRPTPIGVHVACH